MLQKQGPVYFELPDGGIKVTTAVLCATDQPREGASVFTKRPAKTSTAQTTAFVPLVKFRMISGGT